MKTKMKCIFCGCDNFTSESIRFNGASEIPKLKELSEINNLDYLMVICDTCIIGLAFVSLSAMFESGKTASHKIISESFQKTAEKIFITGSHP